MVTRCASAIQIVRPLESIAGTQPQFQTCFAEIVSGDFPLLHVKWIVRPLSYTPK